MSKNVNSNFNLSNKEIKSLVYNNYGFTCSIRKLDGEKDLNFRLLTKAKEKFYLKIYPKKTKLSFIIFQTRLLDFLSKKDQLKIPTNILSKKRKRYCSYIDTEGEKRYFRINSWIEGRLWSKVSPIKNKFRFELGKEAALITKKLKTFKSNYNDIGMQWDISNSLWTTEYLNYIKGSKDKKIIKSFQVQFKNSLSEFKNLRKSFIHNDVNDNNIIVSNSLYKPKINGIVDFGDSINSQIINDVAVTCVYAMMDCENPLEASTNVVKGYNSVFKLKENELEFLYIAIAMRLVISITKSSINKIHNKENSYLTISENQAIELIKKWHNINNDFATFSYREACGYSAHPNEKKFNELAKNISFKLSNIFPNINKRGFSNVDLSVSSNWLENKLIEDNKLFENKIKWMQKLNNESIIAGGYLEPRILYNSNNYSKIGNNGIENRTIHLGIDLWLEKGTPIHAFIDGKVVVKTNNNSEKGYGGLVILEHKIKKLKFYSLYGHLCNVKKLKFKIGDKIRKGSKIGYLGDYHENGSWSPHLHFQLMLSLLGYKNDFPGVCYYSEKSIWASICPDPNKIFKSKNLKSSNKFSKKEIIKFREKYLAKNLSLSYKDPIKIVRGIGQYLIDENGRKYLDTVNNIAHVGHENTNVVNAGQKQMGILNTNTRYLHPNIIKLSLEILKKFPKKLCKIFFVNSGSEANELAIRLMKNFTSHEDIIVFEGGYHGNTNSTVEISNYKYMGLGGKGESKHVHSIPIPDSFRGKYRGEKSSEKYVDEVSKKIMKIKSKGKSISGMIVEPIISCGGQIELPNNFLKNAYQIIKKNKGLLVCDEIQTGFGRVGDKFWGFELHNVLPDIVTLGKPMGNGHPIGAVVCSKEIANAFDNGMEFFSSFGGNPVSCAIAISVLDELEKNKLQKNAKIVGDYIKYELIKLSKKFNIISNVRGKGLFIGFELTSKELIPFPKKANYLVNRMKEFGILMSSDGVDKNVIKIKPPLIFSKKDADTLIYFMKKVLKEDAMNM